MKMNISKTYILSSKMIVYQREQEQSVGRYVEYRNTKYTPNTRTCDDIACLWP